MSSIPKKPVVKEGDVQGLVSKWLLVGWEDHVATWGLCLGIDSLCGIRTYFPHLKDVWKVATYQIIKVGSEVSPPE